VRWFKDDKGYGRITADDAEVLAEGMCHIMRFEAEARGIEHRALRDGLGLMRQMGVL
jgi:hypothetical protein